jgi:hypothetical protein
LQISSNVQKVFSVEKYSKNIGLVYKELWRLDAQLVDGQTYENNAVFGFYPETVCNRIRQGITAIHPYFYNFLILQLETYLFHICCMYRFHFHIAVMQKGNGYQRL